MSVVISDAVFSYSEVKIIRIISQLTKANYSVN